MVLAEFNAPWSRSLRLVSGASTAMLLSVALLGLFVVPGRPTFARPLMVALPLFILIASLPFMVRGYAITGAAIQVRRLMWSSPLPLEGLVAVTGEPEGLRGAVRIFGNGGLFGISGWFWSRRLGRFRAYATDPGRVVLLRYRDGKKVIVTPGDVQHFIVCLRTQAKISSANNV
jgi:hypothetical protein